jgi:NADH-quinone oxidoreductase subunit D
VLTAIDHLEERTKYYAEVATTDPVLRQRLVGVGHLSHDDAVLLGTVGPTGRASGVARDTRRDDPYLCYGELQFDVVTSDKEDVYGRTLVRVGELLQSYRIIRQVAATMPDGPLTVKAPRKVPVGEALVRYEAPRGENVHIVRGNGTDKPERVKVRAPTLANTASVARMMEKNYLADVPIIVAAIDPCFSCTDRAIRVVGGAREGEVATWRQLRQAGIEFYRREAGVDFGALNKQQADRLGPLGRRP